MKLAILDQGAHHVVVNKPAGVLSVRARGGKSETVIDLAEKALGRRVLPVHRLDRPTSGCMALALTDFGQQALSDAFRRHRVDKRYLAVVAGAPERRKLAIDARLDREEKRDAGKGPAAIAVVSEAGKRALTRVEVLASSAEFSLVLARPETGRMHQIRAHLAHVGHPLVGDWLYGGPEWAVEGAPKGFLLHALLLSLPAPKGPRVFAAAPLPRAWEAPVTALEARPLVDEQVRKFQVRPKKK